jgi:phosphohistidine phosphatase
MMRHVWVLRHAKAAAAEQGGDDHARRLTPRGHRQGAELAARLPGLSAPGRALPTHVVCSSARRARETADALIGALGTKATVDFERALYGADAGEALTLLRLAPDTASSVMVVGHNPTLHELVDDLLSPDDQAGHARLQEGFPTAALAVVRVEAGTWSSLAAGTGWLEELVLTER